MHWSQKYIEIPFKEGGRNPGDGGLDCYGLIRYALHNEVGILLPELAHVQWNEKTNNRHEVIKAIAEFDKAKHGWQQVPVTAMQPFDILILNVLGPFHVGLAINSKEFLHTENGANSCVESTQRLRWQRRVHSCWRNNQLSPQPV